MPYLINGIEVKCKQDYLSKGDRQGVNLNVRCDLYQNFKNLSKATKIPMSVLMDNILLMIENDEELLDKLLKDCRDY